MTWLAYRLTPFLSRRLAHPGPFWRQAEHLGVLPERTSAGRTVDADQKRLRRASRFVSSGSPEYLGAEQTDIPHVPRVSPRWPASYTGSSAHQEHSRFQKFRSLGVLGRAWFLAPVIPPAWHSC